MAKEDRRVPGADTRGLCRIVASWIGHKRLGKPIFPISDDGLIQTKDGRLLGVVYDTFVSIGEGKADPSIAPKDQGQNIWWHGDEKNFMKRLEKALKVEISK